MNYKLDNVLYYSYHEHNFNKNKLNTTSSYKYIKLSVIQSLIYLIKANTVQRKYNTVNTEISCTYSIFSKIFLS